MAFGDALTLLFIALKLGDVIDWSWWWVLSPQWISFLCFVLHWFLLWADSDYRRGYIKGKRLINKE